MLLFFALLALWYITQIIPASTRRWHSYQRLDFNLPKIYSNALALYLDVWLNNIKMWRLMSEIDWQNLLGNILVDDMRLALLWFEIKQRFFTENKCRKELEFG